MRRVVEGFVNGNVLHTSLRLCRACTPRCSLLIVEFLNISVAAAPMIRSTACCWAAHGAGTQRGPEAGRGGE